MQVVPVSRAVYLIQYINLLRELGTPVESELARAKLPLLIEELPEAYVSNHFALDFVSHCARSEGIDDLGFLATKDMRYSDFEKGFRSDSEGDLTLCERLKRFAATASNEGNLARVDLITTHGSTKITSEVKYPKPRNDLQFSEWLQVRALIALVRSVVPGWCPTEIAFRSNFQPCDEARDHFGNTRLFFNQPETSITMPTELLATPCSSSRRQSETLKSEQPVEPIQPKGFIKTLRNVVRPYLRSGEKYPSIGFVAGLAGTSARSLQRKLARRHLSYSQIIQQARFESAIEILQDPKIKIIDVAMATGYDDAAHFARAFRKISGLPPLKYRQAMIMATD